LPLGRRTCSQDALAPRRGGWAGLFLERHTGSRSPPAPTGQPYLQTRRLPRRVIQAQMALEIASWPYSSRPLWNISRCQSTLAANVAAQEAFPPTRPSKSEPNRRAGRGGRDKPAGAAPAARVRWPVRVELITYGTICFELPASLEGVAQGAKRSNRAGCRGRATRQRERALGGLLLGLPFLEKLVHLSARLLVALEKRLIRELGGIHRPARTGSAP
jgi:hypothetical protein